MVGNQCSGANGGSWQGGGGGNRLTIVLSHCVKLHCAMLYCTALYFCTGFRIDRIAAT